MIPYSISSQSLAHSNIISDDFPHARHFSLEEKTGLQTGLPDGPFGYLTPCQESLENKAKMPQMTINTKEMVKSKRNIMICI